MESFTHFQNMNEVNSGDSIFGGIFEKQSGLDTAIGLRHDSDIGQINSLFDDIKKKDGAPEHHETESIASASATRNKRALDSPATTPGNNGNNTIWIIVGVIFIILLIVCFVLYRLNKRKSLAERAKTMYSNISNKLSSLRGNTKNTVIDEE